MKNISRLTTAITAVMLMSSCDEGGVERIMLDNGSDDIVIESLSPAYGYPGDEFEIVGKNFGYASDFIKVTLGDDKVKVINVTDDRIKGCVPMTATSGIITVSLFDRKLQCTEPFKVLGQPSVDHVDRTWGFVSDKIHFTGTLLGTCAEDIRLYFGNSRVTAIISDWSEDGFTATIPTDATSGALRLMVHTHYVNTPVDEFVIRQHASVTAISPSTVYAGNSFTISGHNLGEPADICSVTMGGEKTEIISWTETSILAKIPVRTTLRHGEENEIEINTRYETLTSDRKVILKDAPVVNGMSATSGYVGTQITFTGSNLPGEADDIAVVFGDVKATVTDYNITDGNGTFSVGVPVGTANGIVDVTLSVGDLLFHTAQFEIFDTPSLAYAGHTVVRVGESLDIYGSNLGHATDALEIRIAGVKADITAVQPEMVTVTIPASLGNTENAAVEIFFQSVNGVSDVHIDVIATAGDITGIVLKNACPPYRIEGSANGNWGMPADWKFNSNMWINGSQLIYPLLFDNDYPDGIIGFWCHKWTDAIHKNYIENGKIYQTVTLPAGTYHITADIAECNMIKGDLGVVLGASERDLPDIEGSALDFRPVDETAYWINPDGTYAYDIISDETFNRTESSATPHYRTITVSLDRRTKLNIGVTATATMRGGNGCSFEIRRFIVRADSTINTH